MKREDWEAPDIPKPARLTDREMLIVYENIERGASEWKLAEYFETDVAHIRYAHTHIRKYKIRMAQVGR